MQSFYYGFIKILQVKNQLNLPPIHTGSGKPDKQKSSDTIFNFKFVMVSKPGVELDFWALRSRTFGHFAVIELPLF